MYMYLMFEHALLCCLYNLVDGLAEVPLFTGQKDLIVFAGGDVGQVVAPVVEVIAVNIILLVQQ